jgi:hypothetical protein
MSKQSVQMGSLLNKLCKLLVDFAEEMLIPPIRFRHCKFDRSSCCSHIACHAHCRTTHSLPPFTSLHLGRLVFKVGPNPHHRHYASRHPLHLLTDPPSPGRPKMERTASHYSLHIHTTVQ